MSITKKESDQFIARELKNLWLDEEDLTGPLSKTRETVDNLIALYGEDCCLRVGGVSSWAISSTITLSYDKDFMA